MSNQPDVYLSDNQRSYCDIKDTSHDLIFQISLFFSIPADIFAYLEIETPPMLYAEVVLQKQDI